MDHHGHHSWGHHHGHHHHRMHPHFGGMGWGRPFGFMLLPVFALFFGLFMLMLLFKSGLWIPLLLIGAFFFFFRPMSRGGWGSKSPEEWDAFRKNMREKMKNEWSNCRTETPDVITTEKPKRSDTTEFV